MVSCLDKLSIDLYTRILRLFHSLRWPRCSLKRGLQGVVTPIVRVGPFATGVKMQSRGQAGFLALVKRSRGLSGSVNGQDQLSPKPIPTRILILQVHCLSQQVDLTVTGACARADFSLVLEPETVIHHVWPLN